VSNRPIQGRTIANQRPALKVGNQRPLTIQVILIAVVSVVAATYEKISALPEIEPTFRKFLWGLLVCRLSVQRSRCLPSRGCLASKFLSH
jgi:hypothetical protein